MADVHHAERTYSPREFADALGVSESTMKRWIDAGQVEADRTTGGHRRVPLRSAIRFIRERQMKVVDPAVLGLADLTHVPPDLAAAPVTADLLTDLLASDDAPRARGVLVGAYLRGEPLAPLCDGPIRTAMHRLGELWHEAPKGIYIEHRALDVLVYAFQQIRSLLPPPRPSAPLAVGGALGGDPYLLPTLMAATVLSDSGFAVHNLGPDMPVPVLAEAAREAGAALVWLSVSVCDRQDLLQAMVRDLAESMEGTGAEVVVGGRRIEEVEVPERPNLSVLTTMSALSRLAQQVRAERLH